MLTFSKHSKTSFRNISNTRASVSIVFSGMLLFIMIIILPKFLFCYNSPLIPSRFTTERCLTFCCEWHLIALLWTKRKQIINTINGNLKAKQWPENNANAIKRILRTTSNKLVLSVYLEKVLNVNSICVCVSFYCIPVLSYSNCWPKTSIPSFNKKSMD